MLAPPLCLQMYRYIFTEHNVSFLNYETIDSHTDTPRDVRHYRNCICRKRDIDLCRKHTDFSRKNPNVTLENAPKKGDKTCLLF